jgi:NAD-dependent deacetylase
MKEKMETLRKWISDSDNIVFFGGAGVSTESGIPDFRSMNGLYHLKYQYPPEQILSHTFFMKHTEEFYEFYRDKMIYTDAAPNITHRKLYELEEKGRLSAVVTQNIDGLHQKAGNKKVYELHGSVNRNYCMKCMKAYDLNDIISRKGIPYCECGGIVKPDVVLYEEPLNEETIQKAINVIRRADILIVGGTSLNVYPAAGLVEYYQGSKLVLINKSTTAYDNHADLLMNCALGEVFSQID